jgi:hypothetical protein
MKPKIGIVSHDAGGAELISRLLKRTEADYLFSLQGPAIHIFKENIGNYKNIDLDILVAKSDYLICGTSWQSTHENQALCLAKENNKRVISVLDHYSCYVERYVKNSFRIIPTEFWVTDEKSMSLVRNISPMANITIVGNPYLDEMKINFNRIEKQILREDRFDILYLTEPFAAQSEAQYGHQDHWKLNEFTAFQFLISNIEKITNNPNVSVFIRHHPAEKHDKYRHLVGRRGNIEIKLSLQGDLLVEMAHSHAVVGVDTLAMLLALGIGKPVYSSLPPFTLEATLPRDGIVYLREL